MIDVEAHAKHGPPNAFDVTFKAASLCYFRQLWKKELKNIKIRKWLRFTQCDTCAELRNKLRTFRNNNNTLLSSASELKLIKKDYKDHLDDIDQERAAYYARRLEPCRDPNRLLCCIANAAV